MMVSLRWTAFFAAFSAVVLGGAIGGRQTGILRLPGELGKDFTGTLT
jgi:hypothetical protein